MIMKVEEKTMRKVSSELSSLDAADLRILRILQQDGRITNLKLAEAVALSPTAVLARVQRLTRDGFILGYEARLDPHKLEIYRLSPSDIIAAVQAQNQQVAVGSLGAAPAN